MHASVLRPAVVENARVLLLEDDPDTALALTAVLRSFGCEVTHVDRIAQARQRAREGEFDLAILDIELPDGSGLDFVLHLRRSKNPCAALVLTGSRRNQHLQEAVGLGVTEYLLKPIDSQALAEAISRGVEQTEHMRRWLERVPDGSDESEVPVPLGLGNAPADVVRRVAIEFALTDREADALTLVVQGYRDLDIAERLEVSYSRVRQLLAKAFRKLGLRSRNDLIRFLCERGHN